MKIEERFEKIATFLKKHEELYQKECLKWRSFDNIYYKYSKELYGLSDLNLASFENTLGEDIKGSKELETFLFEIRSLIDLPFAKRSDEKIPINLQRKMSLKKRHELEQLIPVFQSSKYPLFDIGGGVGHSSSLFSHLTNKHSYCFDMNDELQDTGKKRLESWAPDLNEKIEFVHKKVEKDSFEMKDVFLLGLHSCGALSSHLTKYALLSKQYLNFGCCYHKLLDEYNLSLASQKWKLQFSKDAFELAAKGYSIQCEQDIKRRKKIKSFRYALRFLREKEFQENFSAVGSGHDSDYQKKFSFYVKKFDSRFNKYADEDLDVFYQSKVIQDKIKRIYHIDYIRSMMSRLIELYIVLDRAIFLKENGKDVTVLQYFDRSISPRNLGISIL